MSKPTTGQAVHFRPAIDDNLRSGTSTLDGTVAATEERGDAVFVDIQLAGGDFRSGVAFVPSVPDDNGAYATNVTLSVAEQQLAADQAAAAALAAKIEADKAAAGVV